MASVIANPFDFSKRGKKTVLYDYCQDDSRRENSCVFICTTSGRQTFARDISVDLESRMIALGGYVRWWDRLSLFGPVGVLEVEIKFLSGKRSSRGFQVVVRHPDRGPEIEGIEQAIRNVQNETDTMACGVDVNGERHERGCANETYDPDDNEELCPVTRARHLSLQVQLIEWTPCLLDYFWQHPAHQDGFEFLWKKGFIHTYENLAYDRFLQAEEPYGGSIDAIQLVSGWKVERLLWTTLIALVSDVCIVALASFLTKSLAGGLAVGSYAVAIQAILLALLTMLSAVLA